MPKTFEQLRDEHLVNYRLPDGPNRGAIRPAWILRFWPLEEGQPQKAQIHLALDLPDDSGSQSVASKAAQGTPDGNGVYPEGTWWYVNAPPASAAIATSESVDLAEDIEY